MELSQVPEETIEKFSSLPLEIVLFHLPYSKIIFLCRTSKSFNRYCEDDGFWRRYSKYVYGVDKLHFPSWKITAEKINDTLDYLSQTYIVKMDAIALIFNWLNAEEIKQIINPLDQFEGTIGVNITLEEIASINIDKYDEILLTLPPFPEINFKNFRTKAKDYILVPTRYYINGKIRTFNFDIDRHQNLEHEIEKKFSMKPSKFREYFDILLKIYEEYGKGLFESPNQFQE